MVIKIEFTSTFEMLDLVQVVSDQVVRSVGLDDDSQQWVGVALRESVINAIKHGNRHDTNKYVFVEFSTDADGDGHQLVIRVRDQGEGFDPATVPDPLAPENVLKSSGRGMLLIRSFMDDVQLGSTPGGGTEVRMMKRIPFNGGVGNVQV
jgi:serine/threonine-protein kinase RsbW